jgi:ABC-type multidrug transport system permease subunit
VCCQRAESDRPLSVRNPETAQSVGFIWVVPLVFASSAFVPTDSMPGAVQAFADINPVTLTVDAARALTIGEGDALAPTWERSPG